MKPIKGMNLDVSPDAQPPNTYRHARNWVYDKTFDGLMQEPGRTSLAVHANKHVVGQHAFENGDVVFLTINSGSSDLGGEEVLLYTAATDAYTVVYNNVALTFHRALVYDFASFRNRNNERILIISDGVERPLSINVDASTQPAHDLQYLFPTRLQPYIKLDQRTAGSLKEGTHFVALRYVMADDTVLSFSPLYGPFRVTDSVGFLFDVTLDTNYKGYEVAIVSFVDDSPSAFIAATGLIVGDTVATATQQVYVEGTPIKELVLEDVIVQPSTYATAGSVEVHENRLYLGNVTTTSDPVDLQQIANKIQPIWYLEKSDDSSMSLPFSIPDDPNAARFQPDEVYAFYVSYIRDDGSRTRAYHIPGRPAPSTIEVKIDPAASAPVSTGTTRTINPKGTLKSILAATSTAGENNHEDALEYLNNDRDIFASSEDGYDEIKYFHTRGTATSFSTASIVDANTAIAADYHRGECGYWENANETYDSTFPVGTSYTWNSSGTAVTATDSAVVLAGQKVRHHRLPSLGWMFENVSGFALAIKNNRAFLLQFEGIELPTGITGAVIHHAKRNNTNNLVLSHTPIHFGAANHYSLWGEGGTQYQDYATPSAINAPLRNSLLSTATDSPGLHINSTLSTKLREAAGDPKQADGTSFAATDYYDGDDSDSASMSAWDSEFSDRVKMHYNKGLAMPHDMLGSKPHLPTHAYTRLEYVLINTETHPDDVEGGLGQAPKHLMRISDNTEDLYFADRPLTTNGVVNGTNRTAVFDFTVDYSSQYYVQYNRPFPQSEVLPARNIRYVPAGVIDDEVKFDNRFGMECLYWDYKLQSAGYGNYSVSGHHNMGARMWYSILNNTSSSDNANATFEGTNASGFPGTNSNRFGFFLNTLYSADEVFSVQRLPFVNITSMRFDCYFGYENQDLVTCTKFLSSGNTYYPPLTSGFISGSLKHSVLDATHGDTAFSFRRYRVTSSTGFNVAFANTTVEAAMQGSDSLVPDLSSQSLTTASTPEGTVDSVRGTVRTVHVVPTYGPIESAVHLKDVLQSTESEFESCFRDTNPGNTNDVSFNSSLLKLNDWVQPLVHVPSSDYPTSFAYRVARSSKQDLGTSIIAYRTFPALDYLEQPRTRGVITNLQSFSDKLLIHHEQSLFVTIGKESVATSSGQLVIGTGDIFRVTPSELRPSEFGFAGTQHKQSTVLTPNGYFFVDALQGKVFLYTGKLEEISARGMRDYFREALKLNTTWFAGSNAQSYYPGVIAEYDPEFNRVMLMIRNNAWAPILDSGGVPTANYWSLATSGVTSNFPKYLDYYIAGDVPGGPANVYWYDTTEILSFSFNNTAWVSFHDLQVNAFVGTGVGLLAWETDPTPDNEDNYTGTQLYKLNDFTNGSITYTANTQATTVDPYIDIAFPAKESVQWQSFSWHTKAIEHVPNDANAGHIDLTKTFVKAAVYNDYQCSGDQTFIKPGDIDIQTYQRVTLRHNGTQYQFNGFRDLVSDRSLRFIDDAQEFVTANINAATVWHDQRRFNSTHAILRLIAPTTTTNLLYLHDVDAKVRKAYR
ncbi:hypothetical protein N9F63_00035 [bacterium]|nr:hypothetical protein [bacterium]